MKYWWLSTSGCIAMVQSPGLDLWRQKWKTPNTIFLYFFSFFFIIVTVTNLLQFAYIMLNKFQVLRSEYNKNMFI